MNKLVQLLTLAAICFTVNAYAADEVQTQKCPEGEEFIPPLGKCAKVVKPTEEEMKQIKAEIEKIKAAEKKGAANGAVQAVPAANGAAHEAAKEAAK